jgi:hypothetical protein
MEQNKWQHLAVINDRDSDQSIYVNGILVEFADISSFATTSLSNTADVFIGRAIDRYMDGLIDDVRIYNYALNQKQILAVMQGSDPSESSANKAHSVPVLYLSFDEGYGDTAYDKSGRGNNGTLYPGSTGANAATSAMWSLDGKYGKAMEFDNDDDYIFIPRTPSLEPEAITISAWINPRSAPGTNESWTIIGKKVSVVTAQPDWNLVFGEYAPANQLLEFCFYDGTEYCHSSNSETPLNVWTQVAITYDPNNGYMTFYKNGKSDGTPSENTSLPQTATRDVYLGTSNSDHFDGLIDHVKIWNYALSPEEIELEYNHGASAVLGAVSTPTTATSANAASRAYCVPGSDDYCAPPVLDMNFDEFAGTTTYDRSGNGNDGVFVSPASSPSWNKYGKFGSALEFDGSDDYVNLGTPSDLNLTSYFTVSAWVNDTKSNSAIYSSGQTSNSYYYIWIASNDVCYDEDGGTDVCTSDNPIISGKWHYVTVTKDGDSGTNLRIYVDGMQNSVTGIVGTADATGQKTIGRRTEGAVDSRFLRGLIDQVKIYDYARTQAQIAWDFNEGQPIAYWKFNECAGGTIYDAARVWNGGTANNGTLQLGSNDVTATGTCASSSNTFWYNGRNGKYGAAGSFDGDDYVEIDDSDSLDLTTGFTIAAWIYPLAMDGDERIIDKDGSDESDGWLFQIGYPGSGAWLNIRTNGGNGVNSDQNVLSVNAWQHVVVTMDNAASVNFYVNGDSAGGGTGSVPTADAGSAYISREASGGNFFDGLIDEVKIWNYALTEEQVWSEYNGGAVYFGGSD